MRIHTMLGAVLVVVLLGGQGVSWANWISGGSGASALVSAGALTVPGTPAPTQVSGGKTVSLTWTAVSGATNYVVLHHTAVTGGTTATVCTSNGASCVDPSARLTNSWYSVQALAGANWLTESARVSYVPDVTTTVTVSSLGSESGASNTDFITNVAANTLAGTSEPNGSIAIKRAGTQIATATANGSGAWTSTAFTLAEGLQNLDAVATDAYANTATATQSNIRLDTVLPVTSQSATCLTPGNAAPVGLWCKQTTLSMTATFSDAGSGLQAETSQYNDNNTVWATYTTSVLMLEANGRVMQLRATDIAGNQGTSGASVTYYIDGTVPTTSNTYPTSGAKFLTAAALVTGLGINCGSVKSACGTAADATSGVASTDYKLERSGVGISGCMNNSGMWASGTCSAFQSAHFAIPNWDVAVNPSTAYPALGVLVAYTLTTHATDAAGNVGVDIPVTWTVTLL